LASPPLPIGALQARGIEALGQDIGARLRAGRLVKAARALEIAANRIFSFTPFTPIWNITGQPAMSVPLHWNRDNVPIGVQFVGRYGDEATLFSLASQLEQAQPWQNRRPQLTAA
jgi:amidase